MSVYSVKLLISQSILPACSEQPKRTPAAEEVLGEMEVSISKDKVKGLIKFFFGKRAFPAVERGDHYIFPSESASSIVELPYGSYGEAIRILQHTILVLIEQDLKTEKDPDKIKELKDDKKNLLEHPEIFGDTTSKYLKMIHKDAGLYKIPSVTYKNEIDEAIETTGGAHIFNYLTVAILRKALEAARAGRSWKKAVGGMFDSRAKIEEFHNKANINGLYKIKLEIKREKEGNYHWEYYDVLIKGKRVPLSPEKK